MTFSKKIVLSAKEICDIIKECGNSKVAHFSYGDLKLTLTAPEPPTIEDSTYSETPSFGTSVSPTREAQIEEQLKSVESDLDQLLISDPLEYERLIQRGDLVDEAT